MEAGLMAVAACLVTMEFIDQMVTAPSGAQ